MWIGVVLLAGAASLPEVFTSVSAAWLGTPDLAAGDLFGAGMTNMLTLGLIDLLYWDKRVWRQTALEQTLIAGVAVMLTGLAALLIVGQKLAGMVGGGDRDAGDYGIVCAQHAGGISLGRYAAA